MVIIVALSFFICLLYICMIAVYITGWRRTKAFGLESESNVFASVIVPMRNEANVILNLLKALEKQKHQDFEVIIIDDHSTDNSVAIVSNYISDKKHFRLLSAEGEGKKNALKEAIEQSSAELIVCTDADSFPNNSWLRTVCRYYEKNRPDMIIMPVVMMYGKSIFQQMQALEFLSLQASTAGSVCAGFPIMCNAANFAFSRKAWESNKENLKEEKLSGDDMFLMMSIKKQNGKIHYLKSDNAVVFTPPAENLAEFFNQRKRWVSKSSAYYDKNVIFAAVTVFLVSAVLILNLFLGFFFGKYYLAIFALIFFSKMLIDKLLLSNFCETINLKPLLKWIFPLSLIYPFYVVFTALSGLFGSYKWKGRSS